MVRDGQGTGGQEDRDRLTKGGTQGAKPAQDSGATTAGQPSPETAGYQLSAHTDPHPTGLPLTFSLGEAGNGEKYPVFKIMCKMFLEKLKGLFFS